MASASSVLSEELFQCSICLDLYTEPVTIPCGHNFCKACITGYWDSNNKCPCPMCKEPFKKRPALLVNTLVSEMIARFRRSADVNAEGAAKPLEVSCDVCPGSKLDQTHGTVRLEEEYGKRMNQQWKIKDEIKFKIRSRSRKIQEIKSSVQFSKREAEKEIADTVEVISALVASIERSQSELIEVIKEKQRTAEEQAEGFIKELEQEVTELQRRSTELEQLSRTEDRLHSVPSFFSTPPHTRNWSGISVRQHLNVGAVRRAVALMEVTLNKEMEKVFREVMLFDGKVNKDTEPMTQMKILSKEMENRPEDKLRCIQQQYAVDVTLDPDTANLRLILSGGGKKVRAGNKKSKLPKNPKRFDITCCVLGKEGFSSGRFYYEVQVKGKTCWGLGVVRESIPRKCYDNMQVSPEWGYWTVARYGERYVVSVASGVPLPLKENPHKVGVFVDFEAREVSFYDVEARTLIFSFADCAFAGKVYPYFFPGWYTKGEDTDLIITPVNHSN